MKKMLGLVSLLCSLCVSYAFEKDIIGVWSFDEGEGGIVKDISGNRNDGVVVGAEWVEGIKGKALKFDGVDDYVEVTHTPSLDIKDAITVTYWMYLSTPASVHTTDWPVIVEKWGGFGSGPLFIALNRPGNFHRIFFDGVERDVFYDFPAPVARVWYFVAATFKAGSTAKYYINGKLMETDSTEGISALCSGIQNLRIGGRDKYCFFNGIIDEVAIYNRELSGDEIKEIYKRRGAIKKIPKAKTEVKEPARVTNLLKNGGLEVDEDKNGIPDGWETGGIGKTLIDNEVFHCGKRSIKIVAQSGETIGIYQWIPYDGKKKIKISGWVKTDLPADIRAYIGISYWAGYRKRLLGVEEDLIVVSEKTGWKQYTAIFPTKPVPKDTRFLTVWCFVNRDKSKFEGKGSAWFDDIVVIDAVKK